MKRKPRHRRATPSLLLRLLACLACAVAAPCLAQAPGGFIEKSYASATRAKLSAGDIQAFVPARGAFLFPAPYNTEGVRLTNAADCGGADCVNYVGYAYWRNINNHVGSDTMYIFLGLDRARGGSGPTLFSYHKPSRQLTKVGPLFAPDSAFSWASGEGWYFSATQPTKLYVNAPGGSSLQRYDVVSHAFETVFDVATRPDLFGANRYVWQLHSSDDDHVHSATLRDSTNSGMLGCLVYREPTREFLWFPRQTLNFNECSLDGSGRWLLILDGSVGLDNRIVDLQTSSAATILDPDGALGHFDMGDGYAVGADNFNPLPNATIRIDFPPASLLRPVGTVVHYNPDWNTVAANHVTHQNRKAGVPVQQQYACGSNLGTEGARENELVCFRLDGSLDQLVVAPVMTDAHAAGGRDFYGKMPKANIDVSGEYLIWTSNLGGNRLDAFLVRVPAELLGGATALIAPRLQFAAPTFSVGEADGSATISVTRTDSGTGAVSVHYATSDGSARAGSDYTAASGVLNWADGDMTVKTFTVPIARDTEVETAETIQLTLSDATGGGGLGMATATLTIRDDEAAASSAGGGCAMRLDRRFDPTLALLLLLAAARLWRRARPMPPPRV